MPPTIISLLVLDDTYAAAANSAYVLPPETKIFLRPPRKAAFLSVLHPLSFGLRSDDSNALAGLLTSCPSTDIAELII